MKEQKEEKKDKLSKTKITKKKDVIKPAKASSGENSESE